MKTSENKARKAKCNLIAEIIENKNLKWQYKEIGKAFIFKINEINITVFHDNIILNDNKNQAELNDEFFWEILEKVLETEKKS